MPEESIGYIQAVSEDLKRVRASQDRLETKLEELRSQVYALQTGKLQTLEVEVAALRSGAILNNENEIKRLREGQTWLVRLVIGACLTGIIGIILAVVSKGF